MSEKIVIITHHLLCVLRRAQTEADQKELQELEVACADPARAGLAFAQDRLENAQSEVKEQFRGAFQELKEALEVRAV